jgi:hypothetical protein
MTTESLDFCQRAPDGVVLEWITKVIHRLAAPEIPAYPII